VTFEEVSKGYKKAATKYHPDKQTKGRGKENIRLLWLKVQRAYETLIDKNGKMKYDSTLPFDNSIPTKEQCVEDEAYFKLFGDAFRRNSIWSKKKPFKDTDGEMTCPPLGNNDTPADEVTNFYKFWTNYESWRCFDHFAKNSHEMIKQAGDRYERRELEKENATEIKVHSKKEHTRMIKLVETARDLDPRLRRIAKEAAENKNNAKA
jgi:DnaJ family protein C protein 2